VDRQSARLVTGLLGDDAETDARAAHLRVLGENVLVDALGLLGVPAARVREADHVLGLAELAPLRVEGLLEAAADLAAGGLAPAFLLVLREKLERGLPVVVGDYGDGHAAHRRDGLATRGGRD